MTYKHKSMRQLSRMIREGEVEPDINIRELIKESKKVEIKKPQRVWKDKPRFYDRALSANARAKKKGVEGRITYKDLDHVWNLLGGLCGQCKTDKNIVFDHVVPYYKGGDNIIENLQLLCRMCNMEKGVG